MSTNQDPNHCTCFVIDKELIPTFQKKLESQGFKDGLQEDHDQVFGLIKTNGNDKQMHVKVMPTGQIEAEIEPSQSYPFAHLNPKHSYSAHPELEQLFKKILMTYHRKIIVPFSCIKRRIIEPDNPTHIVIFVIIGLVALVIGAIVAHLFFKKK